MNPVTLNITADGLVRCLWTEALELAALGRLQVDRAAAIEFDNEAQVWCVFNGYGQCLFSHPSRDECLRWERQHFSDGA